MRVIKIHANSTFASYQDFFYFFNFKEANDIANYCFVLFMTLRSMYCFHRGRSTVLGAAFFVCKLNGFAGNGSKVEKSIIQSKVPYIVYLTNYKIDLFLSFFFIALLRFISYVCNDICLVELPYDPIVLASATLGHRQGCLRMGYE